MEDVSRSRTMIGPFIAILILGVAAAHTNHRDCGRSNSYRIVGGVQSSDCEYPWMVKLFNTKYSTICGGSIIDPYHIVTAAHCITFEDDNGRAVTTLPEHVKVYSGSSSIKIGRPSSDVVTRSVAEVIPHEAYNDVTLKNDIALLRLTQPITYDYCHKPICLVSESQDVYEATGCRVMGWGITYNSESARAPDDMRWTSVKVASDTVCRSTYRSLFTDGTFCGGDVGQDACEGDSGGPFTCRERNEDGLNRFYQYGIVSAGLKGQCGYTNGIYTKVSEYLQWIDSHTS